MFAICLLPRLSASVWAGIFITSISSLSTGLSIKSLSNINSPPGKISFSNLSREGLFITTSDVGLVTIGEPTASSETITEQFAVPPRISGP